MHEFHRATTWGWLRVVTLCHFGPNSWRVEPLCERTRGSPALKGSTFLGVNPSLPDVESRDSGRLPHWGTAGKLRCSTVGHFGDHRAGGDLFLDPNGTIEATLKNRRCMWGQGASLLNTRLRSFTGRSGLFSQASYIFKGTENGQSDGPTLCPTEGDWCGS